MVAVDLRGYGGSDKPPRGYDAWTLAGDTAGLIRALGHTSATLIGHADGGLACWTTALLHSRLVRAIALISSPHPAALRRSTLTRRDQGYALLPMLLRYQVPIWPERLLTRDNGAEIERLVRTRSSAKWVASEDFSQTVGYLRMAIQIPWLRIAHWSTNAGRCAANCVTTAGDSSRSMSKQLGMPLLHLRGDADPYVLADPVDRTQRYAPQGRYVSVSGAGHFSHEEAPDEINRHLTRFLDHVHGPRVS